MKKLLQTVLCIYLTAIYLMIPYVSKGYFSSAFFFSSAKLNKNLETGSIDLRIRDLTVGGADVQNNLEYSHSDQIITINDSVEFSFSIINAGKSAAVYYVSIDISWMDGRIREGKLYLYNSGISDSEILDDIVNGAYKSIGEIFDNGRIVFSVANRELTSNLYDGYSYKLFFYEDEDIIADPAFYHGKEVEVKIFTSGRLKNIISDWSTLDSFDFRLTSVMDNMYPVISEVRKEKVFFISQAENIDIYSYATASDVFDGDITNNITATVSPAFDIKKAGEYIIEFNVSNSLGDSAVPLRIMVVIWDFSKIVSGNYHTVALTSHGLVYTWGFNALGQLGDGTTTNSSVPKLVEGLEDIVDVASGTGCSYALNKKGQLYSWGRNENGRLGDGTTTNRPRPVTVKQNGVKFKSIAARFSTAGAIAENGEVYTWGYGGYGAAGNGKTADILSPEKLNLSGIAYLELGYYNGAAVTYDGEVYTWGDNYRGQLGNGASMGVGTNAPSTVPYFAANNIKITSVSVGRYHMAAVSDDGKLYTWGYGYEGRLGNGSTSDKNTPQEITISGKVKKAQAAYYHTGVLTDKGEAYFFGQNAYGKLGDDTTTNRSTPVKLSITGKISDISLALDSSFVLVENREVFGFGYGGTGVLGTGNNSNSDVPVKWAFVPPDPS